MKDQPTPFFLDRFQTLYPDRAFCASRPLALRVNTIRGDARSVRVDLKQFPALQAVPWYQDAFVLPDTNARQLEQITREGKAYVQSLSSMIPALILAPQAPELILDMAAAPGSKTSQLAALMENRGEIVANDIDRRRLFKLKAVLEILGVKNVTVVSMAGQSLWKRYPEAFDKVLLDAPCSMEGHLFYPSGKKIHNIAKLQRWLLRSAVSAAKPGGTVVYSTCSMAPEENEEVVDWILRKEKGRVELAAIGINIPEAVSGITAWQGRELDRSLSMTLRIPPVASMEQFFVARIRKVASSVANST